MGVTVRLEPVRFKDRKERRSFAVLDTFLFSGKDAFSNTYKNAAAAIMRRQLLYKDGTPVVQPTASFRVELAAYYRDLCNEIKPIQRWTVSQFLDSCRDGKLRKRYANAWESLKFGFKAKWADVRAFLKYEKVDGDSIPRVISPRHYEYLLAVGRYLKAAEGPLYAAMRRVHGSVVVLKGMNAIDSARVIRSKWSRFRRPVAVGADMSRFDQHTSQQALRWEHSVWVRFFVGGLRQKLASLLRLQLNNRIIFRVAGRVIRYVLRGQRMSGDMNTGSGNSLLMVAMLSSYMRRLGIKWDLVDNGDDALIFVEEEHLHLLDGLRDFCLSLGYRLKLEDPVSVFEQIEFCQTHPVFVNGRWTMVRKYREALSKDATCLHAPSERIVKGWVNAVGTANLGLTKGVPVMQEVAMLYKRQDGEFKGIDMRAGGLTRLAVGLKPEYLPVREDARVSFWRAFGAWPAEQLELETHLRGIGDLQAVPVV